MADMMDTLKGILGDDAEDKIKTVLNGLQSGDLPVNVTDGGGESLPSGDMTEYLSQIKSLVGKMGSANDSRSNLLLSLKPYMRPERRQSIDNAVKILNLTRLAGFFK